MFEELMNQISRQEPATPVVLNKRDQKREDAKTAKKNKLSEDIRYSIVEGFDAFHEKKRQEASALAAKKAEVKRKINANRKK